jgi:PAS domain S-box-containing protein
MNEKLLKTGLEVIGDVPWGTHFCQFYQSAQDLVEVLVPYFAAGLRNHEFCMWITSEPLGAEAARAALAAAVPDFEHYARRGQIEIVPHTEWFLRGGTFDSERVLGDWVGKLNGALEAGFEGLRLTGNTFWLEPKDWGAFTEYEAAIDRVIGRMRILALCTYSLDRCGSQEILDVVRNHRFAIVRREGCWELIESAERKRAEESSRAYRQLLETVIHNIPIAVNLIRGSDLRMQLFNPAYQAFAGGKEKAGKILNEIWPETGRDFEALCRRVLETGEPHLVQDELSMIRRRPDGPLEPAYFTWSLHRVRLPGDEGWGILNTVRETTERRGTAEALRQAKAELEIKVGERTAELRQSNERLQEEINERVRTEQTLRLEEARLDALLRLSQMSEASLTDITSFTLEQAIALTQSKIGFVGFLDEEEAVYTLHAVSKDVVKECSVTGDPLQWHVVDAGIWADAIRERRTLFVNDYSLPHPRKKGLPPGHPGVAKFMVVPLIEGGKIVALAGVGNKVADYERSDERQIALLLSGMWGCVQKNRAQEILKESYGALEEKVEQRTASLRESEERLKRAQEMAHLGSWELDVPQNRLTWSDEVYRIFGLTPGEFGATYEAFLEAVHPDDRVAVHEAYSRSLREGCDSYEIEHRIIRRNDREIRIVFEKCEHVRDPSGRVVHSVGMVHDITENRKSEALRRALAEQERLRLGAAVEQASDAVIMLDLDGRIQYVNAAFESINRMFRDGVVGRSYLELINGDPAESAIRDAIAKGTAWHGQLIRPGPDRRPVELEVTISPTTDPSGRVLGGLVTEKDVTQENALQRQVRQAQKMEALGTLAGGITHDFNNILGAITINTELALLDLDLSHPARRPLPTVLQAANRGKELVKQIITFSRQREWQRRPLEVAPLIKEAMKFLQTTLPKDVTIHEMIHPRCGTVQGDPSQINQIIVNLCQNAAQAMPEGGELDVRLDPVEVDTTLAARHPDLKPGPYVRLMVADTGCGMAREIVERIFEPFFTTRGPGGGSGLGLAVVHGIVSNYQGAVTVYSEPGKGSVFSVYLPQVNEEAQAPEAAEPPTLLGGRERILLVEDEPAQRESLALSLKRLGYRVTPRASGRSALSVFKESPDAFDLVITDQTMPHMSGLELAAAIVKIRPNLPIVLCTGFSERVNGDVVGKKGIREFAMKPFTLQEISTVVRKALDEEGRKP